MIPIKDNIPTDGFPVVTGLLILANVVIYLLAISHGGSLWSGPDTAVVVKYGAIPYALTHPGKHCGLVPALGGPIVACQGQPGIVGTPTNVIPTWETIFSSMFMHASLLHIAGNMLFLWIFGNNVEESMGPLKFLAFYLVSGICALALQVAISPNATVPTIGASGAIAGVLGGYIILFPRARILTFVILIFFVTVIELPALVMLLAWFAAQAAFAAADLTHPTGGAGGVAYFAHIGGFIFGAGSIKLLARRRHAVPPPWAVY